MIKDIFYELNNREILYIIVGIIIILYLLIENSTRKNTLIIFKTLINLSIYYIFPILIFIVIPTIIFSNTILWENRFLKYIIVENLILISSTFKNNNKILHIKDLINSFINWDYILAYIIGTYVFSFIFEIKIFVISIIIAFIHLLYKFAEKQNNEFLGVFKCLNSIINLIGYVFGFYCFIKCIKIAIMNISDIKNISTWIIFLIPCIYSILYIFIYYCLIITNIFQTIKNIIKNKPLKKTLMILKVCKMNLYNITRFNRNLGFNKLKFNMTDNEFEKMLKNFISKTEEN